PAARKLVWKTCDQSKSQPFLLLTAASKGSGSPQGFVLSGGPDSVISGPGEAVANTEETHPFSNSSGLRESQRTRSMLPKEGVLCWEEQCYICRRFLS
uniref:Uncharacterized protein n=1 Tax=Chelydra serpentina TaxID=8475 RepID=A0A8C3TEW3_CHESE